MTDVVTVLVTPPNPIEVTVQPPDQVATSTTPPGSTQTAVTPPSETQTVILEQGIPGPPGAQGVPGPQGDPGVGLAEVYVSPATSNVPPASPPYPYLRYVLSPDGTQVTDVYLGVGP